MVEMLPIIVSPNHGLRQSPKHVKMVELANWGVVELFACLGEVKHVAKGSQSVWETGDIRRYVSCTRWSAIVFLYTLLFLDVTVEVVMETEAEELARREAISLSEIAFERKAASARTSSSS